MLNKIRGLVLRAKQSRCAKRGHKWPTDPTIEKVLLPMHPDNDDDFYIAEHTKRCATCGVTYRKAFRHFRNGVEAFLNRAAT